MPVDSLPTTKNELINLARRAWELQVTEDALLILRNLETDLFSKNFDSNWIQGLKIRMQWVAFASLMEKDQLALIKNNLLIPLSDPNFDLQSRFDILRFSTPAAIWPEELPKYQDAFLKNNETIGTGQISINHQAPVNPTIANWLKDYIQMYSMDKQNEMVIGQYLFKSPNIKLLSQQEKQTLEKLLLLFEYLKTESIAQLKKEMEIDLISKSQKQGPSRLSMLSSTSNQLSTTPTPSPAPVPAIPSANSTLNPNQTSPQETEPGEASPSQTIPLKEALKKFPQIASQKITSQPLTLLGQSGQKTPTVQNWLIDYRSRYGVSENTPDERLEFLTKSPNGKILSEAEKSIVETLINSYDLGSPLNISPTSKRIIFS